MSGTIADWERDRFHRATADQIAELPETEEPEHTKPEPEPEVGPIVLMERSTGGWSTELRLCADGRVAIYAQQGEGHHRACFVDPDKALDAFYHPYCYLPAS